MKLSIREETSKTFGRCIKILECNEALKDYIKRNNLKNEDFLFKFSAPMLNNKLKKVFVQILGDKMTKGGKKFSEISMYDFRHSGACYWRLGAYKSKIDGLMYRGGWSNLDMLNYYTKKIGMDDTIEENDLITEADKSKVMELETRLKRIEEALIKNAVGKTKISDAEREKLKAQILTIFDR